MKLWMLIPAIIFLSLIYLGLGMNGHWNYNINDFINGNLMIASGIGLVYATKKVLKKEWDI